MPFKKDKSLSKISLISNESSCAKKVQDCCASLLTSLST